MRPSRLTSENTVFALLSFEGPDRYSLAGGLGVRITELAESLAEAGFETHLIFVGDPGRKATEVKRQGRLTLHRWCQWISKFHPDGVYQGEDDKLHDFNESVPAFILDSIATPAAAGGKTLVVLGEEWHTAEAMCRISDTLHSGGLRDASVLFWNANNTMSFNRINWDRLAYTTTITTVSKYMKHIMWGMGLNPLVIPNGIPRRLLDSVDSMSSSTLRSLLHSDVLLFKMGRWDPAKNWNAALEAAARLKSMGLTVKFPIRGGIEPHGGEALYNARSLGLKVAEVWAQEGSLSDQARAMSEANGADVLSLQFFVTEDLARLLYASCDGVLANSGHEPFGLVGLEAMAAGGVAYTGATGEDYTVPFHNSVVLETSDPNEIVGAVLHLRNNPDVADLIRRSARSTARQFTWDKVVKNLLTKVEFVARNQGILQAPDHVPAPACHVSTASAVQMAPPVEGAIVAGTEIYPGPLNGSGMTEIYAS